MVFRTCSAYSGSAGAPASSGTMPARRSSPKRASRSTIRAKRSGCFSDDRRTTQMRKRLPASTADWHSSGRYGSTAAASADEGRLARS
eukprot:scaffold3567_cov26-Tisochrysis_lutea.AAC.2